jgi:hypothetical protein
VSEAIIRFILFKYQNEILGLGLRKAALLKYPGLVTV